MVALTSHDCPVDVQGNPKTLSVSVNLHWPYSAKGETNGRVTQTARGSLHLHALVAICRCTSEDTNEAAASLADVGMQAEGNN